jgi:hypothetical protein
MLKTAVTTSNEKTHRNHRSHCQEKYLQKESDHTVANPSYMVFIKY